MASRKFEPSPEQVRVFGVRNGSFQVVANAGSGKTTVASELIVSLYLEEEKRRFPRATQHVGGAEQLTILKQFFVVTFTVKAAAELDERVKHNFTDLGIPLPLDPRGTPYRICRTLDSYMQGWFFRQSVFDGWLKTDPEFGNRLKVVLAALPADARAMLSGDSKSAGVAFYKNWGWFISEDAQSMILDTLIRTIEKQDLPAGNPNQWAVEFTTFLQTFAPGASKWGVEFWNERLTAWKAYHEKLRGWHRELMVGRIPAGANPHSVQEDVAAWERLESTRTEFLGILELARAVGYHPTYSPERMVTRLVQDQIAASLHIKGWAHFQRLAALYNLAKVHFLFRDHGDFTFSFVRLCQGDRSLLETDKEYPARGIRRKYVIWDEVQDNSAQQHTILDMFQAAQNVPFLSVAVGDPKQSIYEFKGANPRGFLSKLARIKKDSPDSLLTLTCSFRSAQKIVELGNQIVMTLPSYKETVHPSATIFKEQGEVIVTPPFLSLREEAEWVRPRIEQYLTTLGPKQKIMVVARTELFDHPIWAYLKEVKDPRLQVLTVHKSKGLEADVVFFMGVTAGRVPDYRSTPDQEINLFYVACTRARSTLILCAQQSRKVHKKDALPTEEVIGVSPFFAKVPILKQLCLDAGWKLSVFAKGAGGHDQLVACHLAQIEEKRGFLQNERREIYPDIKLWGDPAITDTGGAAISDAVKAMPKRSLSGSVSPLAAPPSSGQPERLRDRLIKSCLAEYRRNGRVPRLGSDEWTLAVRSNFIEKDPAAPKRWRYTQAFEEQILKAS